MKKSLLALPPFIFLCVIIFLSSCKKEDAPEADPASGLTKIAEGYAAGAATKVELYTKGTSMSTGYIKFYIALYDSVSAKRTDNALIYLTPMMDMGMMQHSAPFENPASETAANLLFPCSAVFIMPSTSGSWTLKIKVHNQLSNKEGTLTIPVTVSDPVNSTVKSFTALNNGNIYFVALVEPSAPKVGINDMEVAIYKKVSMMSFTADSSLSVILLPEMPSMGHSSPNNVNPVHIGNGHYKGKVNFTMTGAWRLNLDYLSGSAVADSTQYFNIEF